MQKNKTLCKFERGPDLVKLIHDVPSLNDKMTKIVDAQRMDSYYDIYKLFFR